MHADFFRSGPDLLIIGENGEQVLVRGYFTLANPPALVSEGGLSLSGKIVGHLAGPVAPGQYAQTGDGGLTDPIGQITTLTGVVEIVRVDGVRETVTEGGSVYQGDVVITGEDGAIEIEFADQSMFSLGGDGRMVLDEMIYDPAEQKGSMGLGVVSGTFSFISGQIAKTSPDAMTLETPVATIGIRGTTIAGSVGGEGTENSISLLADADGHVGEAVISNAAGTVVISQAGATVTMTSLNQAPPPPVIRSPEEIANTYGNVVTNLPSPPAEDNEPTPTEDDLFPQEVQQLNEMMQDLSEAIKKRVEQQYRHAQQEMEAHKVIQHLLREPHITEEFIGNIRQEIVAQVNPGLSLAVSAFSDTVSTITVASSVAAAAEAEAATQSAAIQASATSSLGASDTGLTITQATAVANVIISPLNALNAAAAISAAASVMAKVNQAAALLASTGEVIPENLITALDMGAHLTNAANNVRTIIDAAIAAAPQIIADSVTAAKAEGYNSALSTAASATGGHINSKLAAGTSGLTYSSLGIIFNEVKSATAELKSLLSQDTTPGAFKNAVSKTFEAAEQAITSAEESSIAAHETINATDPAVVVAKAETATAKANLTQTHLKSASEALTAYQLTAPVDASAFETLKALSEKVTNSEKASVQAAQSIGSAQQFREAANDYRDGDAARAVAAAQAARDAAAATAATEMGQVDTAADAVLAARSVLVNRLVDQAVAVAKHKALVESGSELTVLVDKAASSVAAAQADYDAAVAKKAANADN
ncbi:MAG: FecR domain-containing protein, partial [Rhodospirillaceae bacterium]|nr:FecR domain-containing protein [Rhodospirillaceae bacterium]